MVQYPFQRKLLPRRSVECLKNAFEVAHLLKAALCFAGYGDPTYWKGPQTTRGVGPLSGYTQAGASVVAEWGKRGHTLIKAGFPQSSVDPMDLPQHAPGPW